MNKLKAWCVIETPFKKAEDVLCDLSRAYDIVHISIFDGEDVWIRIVARLREELVHLEPAANGTAT